MEIAGLDFEYHPGTYFSAAAMKSRIDCSFCVLIGVNWIPCRLSFAQTTVPAPLIGMPETGKRNDSRTASPGCKSPLPLNLTLDKLRASLRERELNVTIPLEQTLTVLHDHLIYIAHNFDELKSERITL